MSVPFSSALYYPYIDIRNEQWLRNAALFWDSIRTIVPESHRSPYSSAFARELNDEGVLEPVHVSSGMEEIESLTDTVLEFLTDPAAASVLLGTDKAPTEWIDQEKIAHQLEELTEIHPQKLPYLIRSHLDRALNNDGWIQVPTGFANFYMTLLASRLAERLGLGLVTESSAADQLAIAVHKGKPFGTGTPELRRARKFGRYYEAAGPRLTLPKEVASGLLLDLIVEGIELPPNIVAKEMLKFKTDHREELSIFRREISRLATSLPNELSVEALRQSVHDQYLHEVVPALRSLRHSLRAQGWETALNCFLKVSFISAPPTSAAIMAGVPGPIAVLAGVGVSLTASAVLLANQLWRTRLDSPYSYLLSLERRW
jgi:hypothetical protein